MRLALLSLPFAAALASAVPFKGYQQKVKESIYSPPSGWYKHAPAPKHHLLELKIALPQLKFPELEQHLWEVSDPSHPRYGAHLSKQETEALMAPHPETLDIVSNWLASHGLAEEDIIRSSANDWVTIRVPVGLAEEMLTTDYHVYKHAQTGESIVRTMSYSLPESLHDHVDLIQPTTMFARFKAFKSTLHQSNHVRPAASSPSGSTITGPAGNQVDASCNDTITVSCLRQLYNAVDYNTSATNGNTLGITGYLNESTNNKDLQQFYKLQNPSAYGSNYTTVLIHGGQNNQSYEAAGLEANLDTQFGFGLTWPTPRTFYSTGGEPEFDSDLLTEGDTNEPYSYWLEHVLSQDTIPQSISTSYGDDEQTVPRSYATRICNGMAALGARGISVMFSSGDGGVGDGVAYPDKPLKHQCYSNDGHNTSMFLPVFPASCPFVTAVGGTVNIPEIAASFSGGGFSNYFGRPSYQDDAVSAYLATLTPGSYKGLYNSTGRAYPDVSSQAASFLVVYQGQPTPLDGTSCAAPAFTAFVSMLNDARLSAGKAALGFLNPFLYSTGYKALNDITEGRNPGCQTEGFNATVGWDPVTGYGTPNFEKLKDLVMAM
ncbi:peptidase S8/S53 domain-containing protein [Suillus clintonianus]|uniref:peptidase S8/S53 domain-containing protein n=1 Tax=Suillus clintonianus TaxID=1904413 RepID=UPI001B8601E1|nr:peptidase S8/S53 domain-containing protein [Suillus clintonianus]KAG2128979.1 peptidase S8/S53 domain-containing protein [Suillus clintonianus]